MALANRVGDVRDSLEEKAYGGLPKKAESEGFEYRIEYRLMGSEEVIEDTMAADGSRLVISAFLMKFYGPGGKLTNPPAPEYVRVYGVGRDDKPVAIWENPELD